MAELECGGATGLHEPALAGRLAREQADHHGGDVSASSISKPASISALSIGAVRADFAKPGQTAFMRMPSSWSAGPIARTKPTTACLFAL